MTSSGLVDATPPLRRVRYSSSAPLHEVRMRRRVGASGAPPDAPPSPPASPPPTSRSRLLAILLGAAVLAAFACAFAALASHDSWSLPGAIAGALARVTPPASSPRLVTPEELATRDGSDDSDPRVWLAILGVVYDVTAGATHYAPGGAYAGLAARDASAAFHTGDFTPDGLHPSLDALEPDDFEAAVATLDEWSKFYEDRYERVGVLAPGWYRDASGAPTEKTLRVAEARARRADAREAHAAEAARASTFPACGARWTQAEGGEVWCEDGRSHPRKEVRFVAGKRRVRCACFPDPAFSDARQLYPGCANAATRCKTG